MDELVNYFNGYRKVIWTKKSALEFGHQKVPVSSENTLSKEMKAETRMQKANELSDEKGKQKCIFLPEYWLN